MSPTADSPVFVGSQLIPTDSYLRQFVHSLRTACNDADRGTRKELVAAHRSMVLYTLQLLCACTGHRAVGDPFWNLDQFDLANGQVLIDDKSVASQQGYRLTWLPPRACRQMQLYLQHVRNLSRFVRRRNSGLADQLWAVTEANFPRPMPLFFFLEADDGNFRWMRILPGALASMLEGSWTLPLNANRHILSTWLHETGCPSELIDAQLGHIEAGCAPFGALSALAPNEVGLQLRPHLEHFLEEHEWTEVQGLRAPNRLPAIAPAPKAKPLASSPLMGAANRLANREALWHKDSARVIELFKKTFPSYPPSSISEEQLNTLEEQVIAAGQRHGRLLVHLLLFRRHLITLRRNGTVTPLPGRLAIIKPDRHNFSDSSLIAKRQLDHLRTQFAAYLAQQEGNPFSHTRRIAELLISSILFGAQTDLKFLGTLPQAVVNSTWRTGKLLFVDVAVEPSSPLRRWLPDRISEALLVGYFSVKESAVEIPATPEFQAGIREHLFGILSALNAPRPKSKSAKQASIEKLLSPLYGIARIAWKFVLPGAISAYAEGDHACASPLLSNWLRLINGKAGAVSGGNSPEESLADSENITRIYRPKDSPPNRTTSLMDWRRLTKCFGETDDKESLNEGVISEKQVAAYFAAS